MNVLEAGQLETSPFETGPLQKIAVVWKSAARAVLIFRNKEKTVKNIFIKSSYLMTVDLSIHNSCNSFRPVYFCAVPVKMAINQKLRF